MFSHYLITRFNLRSKSSEIVIYNNNDIAISLPWLTHRFELFEKYCFPSVKNQTCNSFNWLVFFDDETPQIFRDKIKGLQLQMNNFTPIFINKNCDFNSEAVSYINKDDSFSSSDYIITTRLDNDDAISLNFIKSVQDCFVPNHNTLIDIRNGYQVTIKANYKYEIREYKPSSNHFISIIEEKSKTNTIFSNIHPAWENIATKVIILKRDKLWIEFIHGNNNLCHTRNYLKRIHKLKHSDFGLSMEIKDSPIKVIFANITKLFNKLIRRN
jgi:hypothetical protein